MKRYIRAAVSPDNVFDINDTKVSYYNEFLTPKGLEYMQKSKNRTGEVVYMTPNEYFKECASKIFNGVSVERLKKERSANSETIAEYIDAMEQGAVFPLPYINYADKSQEGLHRLMAAGNAFGWSTKFPVLVVTAFDNETESYNQTFRKMRNYENYDFKEVVERAAEDISDWDSMAPPDVLTQFEQAIINRALKPPKASIDSHDIDVDAEAFEKEGHVRIKVYLSRFENIEEDRHAFSEVQVWLDDMFDLTESPFEAEDYNNMR